MVFVNSNKDEKTLIVTCNCHCGQEFHISKFLDSNNPDYSFSSHSNNWYNEQDKLFSTIKKRLKRMWFALRGKDYLYQDVCMTKEEFDEFVDKLEELRKD